MRPRCRRAALEPENSVREPRLSRLYLCWLLGLPPLNFLRNLSVPVAPFVQKTVPWQSHRLSKSLPSPAHGAASGTRFQVVPKNSFLASAARARRPRGAVWRGTRGRRGAEPPGEPRRGSTRPRCPSRPSHAGGARGAPRRSHCGAEVWPCGMSDICTFESIRAPRPSARLSVLL